MNQVKELRQRTSYFSPVSMDTNLDLAGQITGSEDAINIIIDLIYLTSCHGQKMILVTC